MSYTYRHEFLNGIFSLNKENTEIPGTDLSIRNLEFISPLPVPIQSNCILPTPFCNEDSKIEENRHFNYPVFVPNGNKNNRAIILLHGLNERDWSKYLAWTEYLAQFTRRTIILFPLAFHMNRGKKEWSDPRSMNSLADTRKKSNQNITQLCFANAALSNRLTEDPMRFYRAGLQSANDLIRLLNQIKDGSYPLLEKNTQVNFMGYSIGAFLTQIMFMANPDNLLGNSKAVLFCGGTTFNNMFGTSKLIMDNLAYEKLNQFYLQEFEKDSLSIFKNHFPSYLNSVIQSFKAMIPLPSFNLLKERTLSRLTKKITAIGLLKDKVIPARDIWETLKGSCGCKNIQVKLADFPYNYTHENPFPIKKQPFSAEVDKSFEQIFSGIACSLK
jgi:pimeloyl-ACP methyl ester carboxylesterase